MAIYRRDDSPFWWAVLTLRGRRPRRLSTGIPWRAHSKDERAALKRNAESFYAREQAKLVLEAAGIGPKPSISVAKYLRWYELHVVAHHGGATREASMLRQLTRELGTLTVAELTRDRILEWRTARATQVAAGTVNRELDVLKAALNKAVPQYIDASPARGVPRLRAPVVPRVTLTPEEEGRLLGILEPEDRAIIIAAVDTLARAGNLVRLEWRDDRGEYVIFRNAKNQPEYEVPVSKRLREALDALPRTHARVFPNRQSQNGRPLELWRMFVDGCRRAGIVCGRKHGGVTLHDLRHTGASRLVANGVDIAVVRALGGWRSYRQLMRYVHPVQAHMRSAVDGLGAGVVITPPSRVAVSDRVD